MLLRDIKITLSSRFDSLCFHGDGRFLTEQRSRQGCKHKTGIIIIIFVIITQKTGRQSEQSLKLTGRDEKIQDEERNYRKDNMIKENMMKRYKVIQRDYTMREKQ